VRLVFDDGIAAVAVEAEVAEVALRRHLADRARVVDPRRRGRVLAEERADRLLGLGVVALAEMEVADVTVPVDQVLRRPVLVVPGTPRRELVVERDRPADVEVGGVLAHVRLDPLERELGAVHADDRQAGARVALVPLADVRERAQAVDARVGPEVDQDDTAAQGGKRERLRVEPA
jgi:hypothetical protein